MTGYETAERWANSVNAQGFPLLRRQVVEMLNEIIESRRVINHYRTRERERINVAPWGVRPDDGTVNVPWNNPAAFARADHHQTGPGHESPVVNLYYNPAEPAINQEPPSINQTSTGNAYAQPDEKGPEMPPNQQTIIRKLPSQIIIGDTVTGFGRVRDVKTEEVEGKRTRYHVRMNGGYLELLDGWLIDIEPGNRVDVVPWTIPSVTDLEQWFAVREETAEGWKTRVFLPDLDQANDYAAVLRYDGEPPAFSRGFYA